jgi:tRNA/tmRNA/rRNA uracil-C5-methylase (TrmA/RlmC/RlmD family)
VRVKVEREQGNVLFASVVEVLTPSPVRVEPPCPYFGRCGGCDFQQLTYEAQLAAKSSMISDCLQRIARLDDVPAISVQPSPTEWHYRVRATWQIDQEKREIGYYERGSRRVCDVAGDSSVSLSPPFGEFETDELSMRVGNEVYQYNAESFFQINPGLLPALIEFALSEAAGKTALDLYCGVGLFTLPLARRFAKVVGVEANTVATRFARRNLDQAGLTNARVLTATVAGWIRSHSHGEVDFILLDPPRAGAESIVITGILDLRPARISYVSCDPATLARDLKKLIAGGYVIHSIRGFDLFPQTHHVETVVLLRR